MHRYSKEAYGKKDTDKNELYTRYKYNIILYKTSVETVGSVTTSTTATFGKIKYYRDIQFLHLFNF